MGDVISTGLAILAVGLMGLALVAMATDNLTVAGMSFFSASIVLYFRETRLDDEGE